MQTIKHGLREVVDEVVVDVRRDEATTKGQDLGVGGFLDAPEKEKNDGDVEDAWLFLYPEKRSDFQK